MTTAAPALQVESLTVRYGPVLALDDASFTLHPGRVCGLVGMNGSGKSTLFKAIMGLVRSDTGDVRIHDSSPARARRAGVVGYMPQSEAIDWTFPLSVRDVVMTGRYGHMGPARRARHVDRRAVDDALARVELSDFRHRQIGRLSGGQRKRAFLARCLAQGAELLLLDEPFAGVDKRSEATICRLLRDLADSGATVLIATHDLNALPELADEAILLMRTVLLHDHPDTVLDPRNLARAFGLDLPRSRGGQ
ncbi:MULTISPECIES: metal ABC transporter ATP-binding protein [Mycolicibacterium]|uniref:ATPase component of Mn/Zn ABC-type transporter n=3 Tax=Mycolicibacterium gilvum TaxID=1804 RepID=E6TJ48_MYCSR|nr:MULTISPECIES: metal ABC transporter ATP-binding protein [Mycolicibacterium]ABP45644.1 ABC transporter related protein [Mycolicibacterium gilvum PYR-GCK]ADT99125.1 ATPase component of Mn/Zn ABC-type transporter [Mycolicibacterium gilvum Spyr1]MBV5243476.1 metal ABC transporter ATP-binding protein [Mycolicibacterium sp. PAM1]MCV7058974.1 metal ABC transporter ATP-binding protein [Mycolicibacterium gilvum]STZ44007.1 ABC transporter-like protein [Mycolicibacterium gilvum]